MERKPEILAPAGDAKAMLAAYAAGADAVYLGLKHFSARMEADNFALPKLARLVELAHKEDRKVFVALNSLLKPNDLDSASRLIAKLERDVKPDSLIVQDIGAVELANQIGFSGEIHLSTLANVTHGRAFDLAVEMGAKRVILPRELNLDEVRQLSRQCPDGLSLEIFIHGALCYCVSGRCYWSSYMGGKSGLRGRCVQPCRRVYQQKGKQARFFSCQDLSMDVVTKTLMSIPKLVSWKIEGRKKGPHYVYHVVAGYKLLRDHPNDPKAKKQAHELLAHALGRPRTKATFLPHDPKPPVELGMHTSSGLFVGRVQKKNPKKKAGKPSFWFKPKMELSPGDFLRVGNEDEAGHFTMRLSESTVKGKEVSLVVTGKNEPKPGSPIFLIDRRQQNVTQKIKEWEEKLKQCQTKVASAIDVNIELLPPCRPKGVTGLVLARSTSPQVKAKKGSKGPRVPKGPHVNSLWLNPRLLRSTPKQVFGRLTWWLPPVIWPNEEDGWFELIAQAIRKGAKRFVLGSPWQVVLFPQDKVEMIAGPFCNVSNAAGLNLLADMGIKAAIVSPELSQNDYFALPRQSPIPLGAVIRGFWPMGISRFPSQGIKANEAFTSPKKEVFWTRKHGQNTWIYPGWELDIEKHKDKLIQAGYSIFVTMLEQVPRTLPQAKRDSSFNWDLTLL